MLTIYFDETLKNKQVIKLSEICLIKNNKIDLYSLCKGIAHDVSQGNYHSIILEK